MNAIAAVKTHQRGHDTEAVGLLERAEDRVGVARARGDIQRRIKRLVAAIAQQDPTQRPLADDIMRLVEETFSEQQRRTFQQAILLCVVAVAHAAVTHEHQENDLR